MTVLSVLSILLLAAALLPLIPLRLTAAYEGGVFTLSGRTGPLPVKLFPRQKARASRVDENVEQDTKKLTRRVPPPVLRMLVESGCETVERLLRRVRICVLRVRYTAAGPDPARAVMAYARAGIAMEGIAAAVDCADLRTDVDLEGDRPSFEGRIGITARLGTVLAAAFCFGIAFLRRYYQYKRERE